MDVKKQFVQSGKVKAQIDDFLAGDLKRSGYVSVEVQKTPMGHRVNIIAERPGMIIGRHGTTIRELATTLEKRFHLENVQISVTPVTVPELNAKVMANRISFALERGVHFRRSAFIALRQIMEAGARGAEIVLSGKLTSERSRFEKFRNGVLLKAGDPYLKSVDEAVTFVLLKPGLIGIKVKILPPVKTIDDVVVQPPTTTEPAPAAAAVAVTASGATEEAPAEVLEPIEEASESAPAEPEVQK